MKLHRVERITVFSYILAGLFFGTLFPACTFLSDALSRGVGSSHAFPDHLNPPLSMVEIGPLFLGLIGLGYGIREIAIRRRQRDALRKQMESAERVGNYGSWELDVSKRTVVWSQGLRALLELDASVAATYEGFMSFVDESDRVLVSQAVFQCVQGRSANFDVEFSVTLSSGRVRRFHSQGAVVGLNGSNRLVGITRDITELAFARKIALEADRERAKAEGVTAALVTCKHEINNPLAIAIAALDGLERRSENLQRLEMAERAMWRIAEIIERMDELTAQQKYDFSSYASSQHQMVQLKRRDS